VLAGSQPAAIAAPLAGARDDLKLINGVGPKNEAALQTLGQYRFSQIAGWTPAETTWVGQHLSSPGRVERERWPEQARLLAAGIETPYARDVKAGRVTPGDTVLTADEAAKLTTMLPQTAPALPDEGAHEGQRPLGLSTARDGKPDDLKRIKGIGQQNEGRLHGLGIWHFEQIGAWSAENVKWVGSYLAFPGRIDREKWVSQARVLTTGGNTEFSKRVDQGVVATSKADGAQGQNSVQSAKPRDPPGS
jgi:predicted flap endonuclease-1-like 5' DNA nuclease